MKEISKTKKDASQDQIEKEDVNEEKEVVTDAVESEELAETEESETL